MCGVNLMNNAIRKKKYRIINRKKFLRFILLVLISVLLIILFFQKRNNVYSSIYEEKYIEVKIKKGDTLWDIARDFMPEGYDIRKMVYEIRRLNNMNNANIYPEDCIKIPVK